MDRLIATAQGGQKREREMDTAPNSTLAALPARTIVEH